jgi:lysophospholipid acyltransferase (LPLAT)-like uncharacterized protein
MTEASTGPPSPRRVATGVVVPHAPTVWQRVAARGIYLLVRLIAVTLRYRFDDRSGFLGKSPAAPVIYATWHNRLALSLIAYYRFGHPRNPTAGLAGMVSASRDGGLLAAILECFQVQPVRGSTSRRGRQALLELTTWAERGYDLAITPDGPRGPCYQVQDGVTSLAQLTGLPILPFSYHLGWKLRLKNWDRFQIPLPFSRCEMIIEQPIRVPREASDQEREVLRQQLEQVLRSISWD